MTDTTNYITTKINEWTDEEVLENFFAFFPRVVQANELIENDEGAVIGQVLVTMVGNKIVFAEPQTLDWPLVPVQAPEAPIDGNA